MNFQSAIRQLRDGKAAKPTSWGGYVKRVDAVVAAYDPTTTAGYTLGAKVIYNNALYICTTAIPSGSAAGPFDSSKWAYSSNRDHTLTFVERDATSSTGMYDIDVTYSATGIATYSDPDPDLEIDGELFKALLGDDWTVGDTETFEAARSGGGRW